MAGKGRGEHSAENGKKGGREKATATLIAQEFRDKLAKRVKADMQSWIDPIEDLAKGHFVEVKQADGTIKVYKKSPDSKAWQTVMDRAFGKPKQPLTGGDDEDKPVGVIVLPELTDE